MKIFDPKLTGSIEILNTISGNVGIQGTLDLQGSLQVNGTSVSSIDQVDNISGSVVTLTDASASLAAGKLNNTTDTLTGDLTVTGKITAQEFHTEFVSASIIYQSGSTQFGDSADDTHVFTGNVGIGVASPNSALEVDGNIYLSNNNNFLLFGTASNIDAYVQSDSTQNLYLGSRGVSKLFVSSSGNIGIGTTEPSTTLDINGGYKWNGVARLTDLAYFVGSPTYGFRFNSAADDYNNVIFYDNGKAYFRSNVGIGTNNPLTGLNDTTYRGLHIDGTFPMVRGSNGATNYWDLIGDATATYLQSYGARNLIFNNNGSQVITIDSNGNAGLGVTPATWSLGSLTALQVRNGGFYGYDLNEVGVTANAYYNNGWKYISTDSASMYFQDVNSNHVFRHAASGTAGNAITWVETMRINTAGEVGIGTDNPVRKLVISNGGANGIELDPNISGLSEVISYNRSTQAYTPLHFEASRYYFGSGNVGIANTSPTNYSGYKMLHIGDGTVGNTGIIKLGTGSTANGPEIYAATVAGVNRLLLNTNASTNVMLLEGSNVGIGGAPSYKLTVNGNIVALDANISSPSYSYLGLFTENGSLPGYPSNSFPTLKTDSQDIYFSANGKYTGYLGWGPGSDFGYFGIRSDSEGDVVLRGGDNHSYFSGNLGIKKTSPNRPLDVNGPIRTGRYIQNLYFHNETNNVSNQYFHIKTGTLVSHAVMNMYHIEGYSYGTVAIIDERFGFHTDSSGNIYNKAYKGTYANNIYKSVDNYVVLVFGPVNTYFMCFMVHLFEGSYSVQNPDIQAVTYTGSNSGAY